MTFRLAILMLFPLTILAQMPTDTLKLTGRCEYVGRTYSITFVNYYRIRIDKVIEGKYVEDYIIVEADMDSGVRFMESKMKKTAAADTAQKVDLFGLEFVPISKVFKCKSKKVTIRVQKAVDEIRPGIVRYLMISDHDLADR